VCNKILSGHQLRQVVEWCVNRRFEDHLCPRHHGAALLTRTEMVFTNLKSTKSNNESARSVTTCGHLLTRINNDTVDTLGNIASNDKIQ
jgi:hypothetical protein